jgi:hypothetical protein
MNLLSDALAGVGVVLLPVAAALLFEELTLGGLVRLLLAPRPGTGKVEEPRNRMGDRTCWR